MGQIPVQGLAWQAGAGRALPARHSPVWLQHSGVALCSVLQHPFPAVLSLFFRYLWTPRAKPPTSLPMPLPMWLWSAWPRPSSRVWAALVLLRLARHGADPPPCRSRQHPAAYGSAMPTYAPSTTRWHIAIVAVFFSFIFSSVTQIRCFSCCSVLSTFETIFVHYYPL